MISLLANVWVRRALAAFAIVAVLAAAFFTMRSHFINEGKQQGVATQTQRSADAIEGTHVADRSSAEQQLAAMQKQLDALAAQAQTYSQLALTLAAQRAAVPSQVAGMTSAQVSAQINAALGKSTAAPLAYTDADNRKIAGCFESLDLCKQQADAQSKGLTTSAQQIAAEQQKYQELAGYTSTLEGFYAQLKNLTATPRRSWRCLKLWKCDLPQISAPDPTKLRPMSVDGSTKGAL